MTTTRFYSTEQLSPRQAILPSGTLWTRDATLARTGLQQYNITELPEIADAVEADADGMFEVVRTADEVFRFESMASFEAAPITLGHPIEPVDPTNWSALAVGHVANVRRSGDLLTADLLISDARGIRAVRDLGWRGLSAGYEARYEPTGDGRMRQTDIVANHVALLPPDQQARCGDLCRVSDTMPARREKTMGVRTQDVAGDLDVNWAEARSNAEGSQARRDMGRIGTDPMAAGAKLVQILDGEATSWFIGLTDDGRAALYQHVTTPPIRGVTSTDFKRFADRKAERENAAMRQISARTKAFWSAGGH